MHHLNWWTCVILYILWVFGVKRDQFAPRTLPSPVSRGPPAPPAGDHGVVRHTHQEPNTQTHSPWLFWSICLCTVWRRSWKHYLRFKHINIKTWSAVIISLTVKINGGRRYERSSSEYSEHSLDWAPGPSCYQPHVSVVLTVVKGYPNPYPSPPPQYHNKYHTLLNTTPNNTLLNTTLY